MLQQVERYFQDIENALSKSITNYNEVLTRDLERADVDVQELRRVLKSSTDSLRCEKSLKTIITYFLEDSLNTWKSQVKGIEASINAIKEQSARIVVDDDVITDILDKLDLYLTVSFEGYQEKGFYAKEYSKGKSGTTSRVGTVHND